jgi:outer membrane protein OmpA-like peptidoglycan-associated protein
VAALTQAQQYESQKPGQKPVITMAREAVVRAEDARVVAIRRERDEAEAARLNAEKDRTEAARIRAEEESQRRAQAEAERTAADAAKQQALAAADAANRDRASAETAKLEADQARLAAEQARAAAAEAGRARQIAADAEQQRQAAEQQQAQLRQQLLAQFSQILQTRDTARGLIVNMSDVLFDTAQYSLKPGAREKLAKVSGIILAHPGLKIEVEGHTDSVGGDDYNMTLSENRANAVRSYLVGQGVSADAVSAKGFGKTTPVADNATAAGRQMNRRVELVVSGEILGTSISDARTSQ